jgi:hypothetical protein
MNLTKSNRKILFKSTKGLICAFFLLLVFWWFLIMLGVYLSDFKGTLKLKNLNILFFTDNYMLKHVLWLYLFPYLGFLFFYLLFSHDKRYLTKVFFKNNFFFQWLYTLLLIIVFFVPFCDIINKRGIYYALTWLYVGRYKQYIIGIVLFVIYLVKIFRMSMIFSSDILLTNKNLTRNVSKKIIPVLYLWYFPFIILLSIMFMVSPSINIKYLCMLLGTAFAIIVNTPLIISYKVIIK